MVAAPDPNVDAVLDRLRGAGLRITASRRVIVSTLLERDEHLTTDALVLEVKRRCPDASRATVYRTVSVLGALGLLEQHDLGPGPASYHLGGHDHRHLVCEFCGAVVPVRASVFERLAEDLRRYGFDIGDHQASVTGRCERCSIQQGSRGT
jgi:Fe2+ or Zn2+ uptake regulation protein